MGMSQEMTDDEVDRALKRILTESGAIVKSIESPSVRVLAGGLALLVLIVARQQKQIKAALAGSGFAWPKV